MSTTVNTRVAFVSCLFVAFLSSNAAAQHGELRGHVIDAKTKEPLPYASVMIVGTSFGAMALNDGSFVVRGLPVGTHTVKAMMMGYKAVTRHIAIDASSVLDLRFELEATVSATLDPIVVLAIRKLVETDTPNISYKKEGDDLKNTPGVETPEDAMIFATGVIRMGDRFFVNGGRDGETLLLIDGVPAKDPLGTSQQVSLFAAEGTEFIAGAMDAEFGNAQSAVFNVQTREGGPNFGGDFRYMTDDFGRADHTYTNYDNVNIGFGGPTPLAGLRYFVSGEATFSDGENVNIERRTEHRVPLLDFIKARDRMTHRFNFQSKLSWKRDNLKVTGEVISQQTRTEEFHNNWNVDGYARKVHYFQRLVPTGTGADVFSFAGVTVQNEGAWLDDVSDPNKSPNPRPVVVEQIVIDPESGDQQIVVHNNFRAVDIGGMTILWDEAIQTASGVRYKSWSLFDGFQFPFSEFSEFADDSSFVEFNSADRTPELDLRNLQIKLGINHNISEDLLYTIRVSRFEFNRTRSVNGKSPEQYSTAGLPTTLPDGTHLQGGVSQAVWYTDPNNPYFATAYDFPVYSKRKSIRYIVKSDVTSERVEGHRTKVGMQFIYNNLNNDDRAFPGQQRVSSVDGSVQQGLNVNRFHNFSTEGAVYAQDKWAYEGLVANAGVRLEYFSTGNTDEILINNSDIASNVDRYKFNWSPRIGFAFPITDRDKFFFHYGRFTQWPSQEILFASQDAIGAIGTLGNPNMEPELNVSYRAGVAHQFSDDIVGNFVVFSRDIYGLVSSTSVTDDTTGVQSFRFVNRAYASSRGLELSLEKRLTRRIGFETYYTYSFADGVASNADFGRTAAGLTHLPTDERPLDWDQRHTFSFTLRLRESNDWGATAVYQFGSGFPWTPVDRFARLADPTIENSRQLPATHQMRVQGQKKFNIYGRELTLFVEGRNLLDQDILAPNGIAPQVTPNMVVAQMDGGAYLTETGRYGGAYLQDVDDDGADDFVPVNDPSVFEPHRVWRVGFGFQF